MASETRRRLVGIGLGLAALGLIATTATAHRGARHRESNPFKGARLFVDRDSNAHWTEQKLRDRGRLADARAMAKIADHPWASWFGDWDNGHGSTFADVRARVDEIVADGSLPVLVAYNIPMRDCNGYSAGGAGSGGAYLRWIRDLTRGIGQHRAVVILEPDALAGLDCRPLPARRETVNLLRGAVEILTAVPTISVYIDAGNESWHAPATIAARLRASGIGRARGFALNVSNFYATRRERAYGHRLSSLLGGKPFVIDTSRNGHGHAPGHAWCNPPGRGLGLPATANTHDRLVDAYLWVKPPGESDGPCRGGPKAGVWWPRYALGLARRASF